MIKKLFLILSNFWALASCSGIHVESYKDANPKLNLQSYLDGNIRGWGIVQDRRGYVTKKFDFQGNAFWHGDSGQFNEKITYDNGEVESRIWLLTKLTESSYEARTADVVGKAEIKVAGNAMNWRYVMDVKVDGSVYRLDFDDWMFLMNDGKLINRNYFKKFGINVGQLTLFMQKES